MVPELVIEFHEFAELVEAGGLLEVAIGTELEAAFDVAIFGGGAEHNCGNDAAFGMFIQPLQQFEAGAARHFQIGDNGAGKRILLAVGIGPGALQIGHRIGAVGGDMDWEVDTVFGKSALQQEGVVGIILGDEDNERFP